MTLLATMLLVVTMMVALADWIAVAKDQRSIEYLLKPLVMVGLVGIALTFSDVDSTARVLMVLGLLASMVGDVFLMTPRNYFLYGLSAFFVAHVLYIAALIALGISPIGFLIGILVMVVVAGFFGLRIVQKAKSTGMSAPVAAYMLILSIMVAAAFGTGIVVAAIGAVLFAASDTIIGWTKFVKEFPRSRTIVMVTYHLGQLGLVLALL